MVGRGTGNGVEGKLKCGGGCCRYEQARGDRRKIGMMSEATFPVSLASRTCTAPLDRLKIFFQV